MVVKVIKFKDKTLKINTSAVIALHYRNEFGKDLFKLFGEFMENHKDFNEENIDMELIQDLVNVSYLMVKCANDDVNSLEDFYSMFSMFEIYEVSTVIFTELMNTQKKTVNANVGYKKKKKKK